MKKLHPAVTPICLYCEHARRERKENEEPSFRDVLPAQEEPIFLICRHHGKVAPGDTCLRFSFDPIKYKPTKPLPLPALSEEDVIE